MENKVNPNGVNNENEVVKKAAPPPMKRVKKGEQSAAVAKAAKAIEEKKKVTSAPKVEVKENKEDVKVTQPVVADEPKVAPVVVPEVKNEEPKVEPVVTTEKKTEKKTEPKVAVVPEIKKAPKVSKPEKQPKEAKEKKIKKPVITAIPVKEKLSGKNLKVIIPIVAIVLVAIIIAIVLVSGGSNKENIVVTDSNGVPVTDVNGEVITVSPEDVTAQVPVTDVNGNAVTDVAGNVVTEVVTVNNNTNNSTSAGSNNGTTVVLVTDGKGNTGVDEQGNPITTIVEITEAPVIDVEPAKTEWKNTQGGSSNDWYKDVILTSDGCYITANVTTSKDGDFTQYKDMNLSVPYTVLTKYDKEGGVVWQKVFGSDSGSLELVALSPAEKGAFYAVGYGKAIENLDISGWYDGAIYKIDKNGKVDWVKKFGTSTVDIINDVVTASNGDAIVVGSAGNNDGDAEGSGGNRNESKAFIMRYSDSGKLLWKEFAGGNMDTYVGVAEGTDGSIYALGNFYSGKMFPALGKCDSGVVKYSSDGVMLKKTAVAGTGIDEFKGITASSDGGVVICGTSDSSDTNENCPDSFFRGDLASRGGYDSYIIKYTSDLTIIFATPVRGQNNDIATSVIELPNGNYIMAGSTNSSTRDFKGITTRGKKDIFVASFNQFGVLIWVRAFGGTENDGALALCNGADGGYVVVGESLSNNVDLEGIAPYGGNGKSLAVMVKFPE